MFNGGYRERLFENVGSWTRLGGNVSGETFSVEAFCSLRSHGTRFAYGRLRAQALSQPCLVMENNRLIQDSRL